MVALQFLALLSAPGSSSNPLQTQTVNSCSFCVPLCHEAVERIDTSDTDTLRLPFMLDSQALLTCRNFVSV